MNNSSGELKSAKVPEPTENDFNSSFNFKLWPNPNNGIFEIDSPEELTEMCV